MDNKVKEKDIKKAVEQFEKAVEKHVGEYRKKVEKIIHAAEKRKATNLKEKIA